MRTTTGRVLVLAISLALAGGVGQVAAQSEFPSKPVRIVVPVAGGTMDLLARLVAPKLAIALGQPVIVDNKPGAGGVVATEIVTKAVPDGYTLLVGATGLAINATLSKQLPYDTLRDLAPITNAVSSPQLLVAHKSIPVDSVASLVKYARQNPGQLSYGSIGMGTQSHLTMEMFKSAASLNIVHVPYKGAAPAVTDLLAGRVQVSFLVASNVVPHVKSGTLSALASTGRKRIGIAPNVPTMIEAGFDNFEAVAWIGFLARAGTPAPIVDRYHRELVQIVRNTDVRTRLEQEGFEVIASSPAEFQETMSAEIARWRTVIQGIGPIAVE